MKIATIWIADMKVIDTCLEYPSQETSFQAYAAAFTEIQFRKLGYLFAC